MCGKELENYCCNVSKRLWWRGLVWWAWRKGTQSVGYVLEKVELIGLADRFKYQVMENKVSRWNPGGLGCLMVWLMGQFAEMRNSRILVWRKSWVWWIKTKGFVTQDDGEVYKSGPPERDLGGRCALGSHGWCDPQALGMNRTEEGRTIGRKEETGERPSLSEKDSHSSHLKGKHFLKKYVYFLK